MGSLYPSAFTPHADRGWVQGRHLLVPLGFLCFWPHWQEAHGPKGKGVLGCQGPAKESARRPRGTPPSQATAGKQKAVIHLWLSGHTGDPQPRMP